MKALSDDSDIDDEDDIESIESNPAQFSEEEEVPEDKNEGSQNKEMEEEEVKDDYDPFMSGSNQKGASQRTWLNNYNTILQKYSNYNPLDICKLTPWERKGLSCWTVA